MGWTSLEDRCLDSVLEFSLQIVLILPQNEVVLFYIEVKPVYPLPVLFLFKPYLAAGFNNFAPESFGISRLIIDAKRIIGKVCNHKTAGFDPYNNFIRTVFLVFWCIDDRNGKTKLGTGGPGSLFIHRSEFILTLYRNKHGSRSGVARKKRFGVPHSLNGDKIPAFILAETCLTIPEIADIVQGGNHEVEFGSIFCIAYCRRVFCQLGDMVLESRSEIVNRQNKFIQFLQRSFWNTGIG